MNKIITVSVIVIIAAIAMIAVVLLVKERKQPDISKQEVQQKFQTLKSQYDEAKANGYDVSEIERLGIQAKQAFEKGDYKKANELLDEVLKTIKELAQNKTDPVPFEVKIETICTDGVDNDGDGMIDNDDGDCWINEGVIYETHPYYYDGTFKGLTEQIPDIADLGVKTIYLMPIWERKDKSHETTLIYLINDYYTIDPIYGTPDDLKNLVDAVHKNDMKILFDLITCCTPQESVIYNNDWTYNISSDDLTKKAKELGWNLEYQTVEGKKVVFSGRKKAPSGKDIFDFAGIIEEDKIKVFHYPMTYWGPAADRTNPELMSYFEKVAEHYVREYDIDGWRVDAPGGNWNPNLFPGDRSSANLLVAARNSIIKIKPEAAFLSEAGLPGGVRAEAEYVSPMKFRMTVTESNAVNDIIDGIAKFKTLPTFLVESHDTPRLNKDIPQLNRAFMVLISTIPGVPFIQAGQEVGAENDWFYSGSNNPKVDWSNGDYELRDFYKKVFEIRNNNNVFKYGDIKNVWKSGDNIYAYSRTYENETVIVVINFNDGEATSYLNLPFIAETNLKDELSGESFIVSNPGRFKISVPAYGSRILTIKVQ